MSALLSIFSYPKIFFILFKKRIDNSKVLCYTHTCSARDNKKSGGIAQLGACEMKSMPPMSNQQSTTSYRVPYKLPFLEEYGGIAQLGERLNGIQEVSGSIPLISTKGLFL